MSDQTLTECQPFLTLATNMMADCTSPEHREPGWILGHGIRTAKIGLHIAEREGDAVDSKAVYIGGLFHDVGKEEEPHHTIGATIAHKVLGGLLESDRLDLVCSIIGMHNLRTQDESQPIEVRIIQDADILDHVGKIETWLGFYWAGSHNQKASDNRTWVEGPEYAHHRDFMRGVLNFDSSRLIYDKRLEWERTFFTEFHQVYREGI